MLPNFHIAYYHRIDSNVRTFSNGYFLTSLYNSLINNRNIYITVLMVAICYIHIGRKEYFFSDFQRIGNRYPAAFTNFGAFSNSYRPPPPDQIWV